MLENKIIFCATDKDLAKDVWPHPKPAGHFVPEEYKKMPRFTDNSKLQSTVKTCIPFLDAMTCGYIIHFDQDYLSVKVVEHHLHKFFHDQIEFLV